MAPYLVKFQINLMKLIPFGNFLYKHYAFCNLLDIYKFWQSSKFLSEKKCPVSKEILQKMYKVEFTDSFGDCLVEWVQDLCEASELISGLV